MFINHVLLANGESCDGAAVDKTNGEKIIDANNNVWYIFNSGQLCRNDRNDDSHLFTWKVDQLVYLNRTVYAKVTWNGPEEWYTQVNGIWMLVANPNMPLATTQPPGCTLPPTGTYLPIFLYL